MKELSAAECILGKKTAVALGIFDGVHRGHCAVIGKAVDAAFSFGCIPAVCSFKTATITTKGVGYLPIYNDDTKAALIGKTGAEYIFMPDFSVVRNMTPEEFVCKILRDKMNAAVIVCGRDFRFGKNAACGTEGLGKICSDMNMKLIVIDDVTEKGVRISSAEIRRLIADGNVKNANILLGHDYAVNGEIINGNHFGRVMNFPTANQLMNGSFVLPKFGVYASYAEIDGIIYRGVTNIGVKPTVESTGIPLAETHFPSYSGDLYGRRLTVRLIDFIRTEVKFDNTDALKKQIEFDTCRVMNTDYSVNAI